MNRVINSSLAKVGLIALALSLGGAITVSGSLSSAFASVVAAAAVGVVAAAAVWEGEAAAEAEPV